MLMVKRFFEFRTDIIPELGNYQMGIFGSKTPTSDIDVGVQYIGTGTSLPPGLAYMISAFENGTFVNLTIASESVIAELEAYIEYVKDQEKELSEVEDQKRELATKYFTTLRPNTKK